MITEETSSSGEQQPSEATTDNGETSTLLLASLMPSLRSAIKTEVHVALLDPSSSSQLHLQPHLLLDHFQVSSGDVHTCVDSVIYCVYNYNVCVHVRP